MANGEWLGAVGVVIGEWLWVMVFGRRGRRR